jgi:hypothetical protein
MICQECNSECTSLSNYNAEHKMICTRCNIKRLGIYDNLRRDDLIKKLTDAHREMHCLNQNVKNVWQQMAGANQEIADLKELLRGWWWYGDGTGMTTPLKDKTKQALGNLVP